jgi:hypothetical protein
MSDDALKIYDVIHAPVCIDCGKYMYFNEADGVMVGKCGCVKERVMTLRQYVGGFEAIDDVVTQSMILAGVGDLKFREELGKDVSELSKEDLIAWIRKIKLLKDA